MLKVGIVGMGVIGRASREAIERGIPGRRAGRRDACASPRRRGYPALPLPDLIERAI